MKYEVALFESDEGFAVCVPSLPGCWSQGATSDEALENIADAVRDYLEAEAESASDNPSDSPPSSGVASSLILPNLGERAVVREIEIVE